MNKKEVILSCLVIAVLLIILSFVFFPNYFIGSSIAEIPDSSTAPQSIGPSAEEQACMKSCVYSTCSQDNTSCIESKSQECQTKCNVQQPSSSSSEEICMEECVVKGCSEYDFTCQNKNKEQCENECGMIKEPEAKNKEEQCIRDCVAKVDSSIICQASSEGEKGNEVCQKCAQECVHLYEGPCLNDEKLKVKQKECETCPHCYGEPVMGDSGEGWDCIVDVECKDATSEWGDNPGTGEGIIEKVGTAISDAASGIVDFFKDLFNIGESNQESLENTEQSSQQESVSSSQPDSSVSTED